MVLSYLSWWPPAEADGRKSFIGPVDNFTWALDLCIHSKYKMCSDHFYEHIAFCHLVGPVALKLYHLPRSNYHSARRNFLSHRPRDQYRRPTDKTTKHVHGHKCVQLGSSPQPLTQHALSTNWANKQMTIRISLQDADEIWHKSKTLSHSLIYDYTR